MPGLYTDGELAEDKGSIFDYEASLGETIAARAEAGGAQGEAQSGPSMKISVRLLRY